MNLALMKFSLLPCGLKAHSFFNIIIIIIILFQESDGEKSDQDLVVDVANEV